MTPRDCPLTKPVLFTFKSHNKCIQPLLLVPGQFCLKRVGEPTILDLLVTKASKTAQRASGRKNRAQLLHKFKKKEENTDGVSKL